MTKKQKEKCVQDLLDKWQETLFLKDWHISVVIMSKDNDDGNCATINPCFTYMNATLSIFPEFWTNMDYIEEYIVHELCHCHIQGLANIAQDLHDGKLHTPQSIIQSVENLTQRFTRCVLSGR